MMIKGIIFDADGTLLNSMDIWESLGEKYLKKIGITPDKNLSKILYSMTTDESALYLKNIYSLSQTTLQIQEGFWEIISDFYKYEVSLKTGVSEFLSGISKENIPMVIATSGNKALLELAFKRLGISDYFKKIFSCTEFNTSKKSADIYNISALFMKTHPSETVVFEDSFFALESAKNAGFRVIGIEDFSNMGDREKIILSSDLYIRDFSDFSKLWKLISDL